MLRMVSKERWAKSVLDWEAERAEFSENFDEYAMASRPVLADLGVLHHGETRRFSTFKRIANWTLFVRRAQNCCLDMSVRCRGYATSFCRLALTLPTT